MITDLPERLLSLAESLEGCEWNHPITAVEDCRAAAQVIKDLAFRCDIAEKLAIGALEKVMQARMILLNAPELSPSNWTEDQAFDLNDAVNRACGLME